MSQLTRKVQRAGNACSGRLDLGLYLLTAVAWIAITIALPRLLPVLPLFILLALLLVWVLPAILRRRFK
jgi:Flp pilus assembly protein TadB